MGCAPERWRDLRLARPPGWRDRAPAPRPIGGSARDGSEQVVSNPRACCVGDAGATDNHEDAILFSLVRATFVFAQA
jgi:hypothetical protein